MAHEKRKRLSKEEVEKIIELHIVYKGNASRASRKINISPGTISKYWRKNGLSVRGKGSPRDEELYVKVKSLVDRGYTQKLISIEFGITHQAVSNYLLRHNFSPSRSLRYSLTKKLVREGDLLEDISEFMGYHSPNAFRKYLSKHPEIGIPESRVEYEKRRIIAKLGEGLWQGKSLSEIQRDEGIAYSTALKYVNQSARLSQIFAEKGRRKKRQKIN